jgi:hypothetical protein
MRRVLAISFAILVVMIATRGVMAQDADQSVSDRLLEILKDRQIISSDEYGELKGLATEMQAEKAELNTRLGDLDRSISEYLAKDGDALGANVTYQVGNGFTFATQDGRFALTIGGFFQFWYQGYDRDRNPFGCCDGYDGMYGYSDGLDRRDVNQFDMDTRFHFQGHAFDPNLTYYFEYAIDYDGWVGLYEGYVDYNVCDWFNVRAGQQRLPLGRQALVHETDLSFGNRAFESIGDYNVNNGFAVGEGEMDYGVYRDLGVMVYKMYNDLFDVKLMGDEGMAFEYMLGVWNGDLAVDNNWMAPALRWAFYPFGAIPYVESDWTSSANPKFGIGMSYAYDRGVPHYDENTSFYGWDAVMTWSGLYLTGEWQRFKWDEHHSSAEKFRQWFVEAGFMVMPQEFELMVRYAKRGAGAGVDPSKTEEWSFGAAYYFEGHNLKGILEIGQQQTDSPSWSDLKDAETFFFRLTFQLEW